MKINNKKQACLPFKAATNRIGVYAILNTVNKKVFIGTGELQKRKATNWCLLNAGKHYNINLQKEWTMFGHSNFKFITLFECENIEDHSFLSQCESYWISITMSTNKKYGYNIYKQIAISNGYIARIELLDIAA